MAIKHNYDFIVLGCGGLGSAALYWLARRGGASVLGIEQFNLGHDFGSSQDHSRIIRLAYDDPAYAALTPYIFPAWRELEDESGVQLVHLTGSIIFGPQRASQDSDVLRYAAAMESTGLPFEALTPGETMQRFPQFCLQPDDQVLYQAQGGLIDPGKANAVHITLARARGATVLENTPVSAIRPKGDGVEVETPAATYYAQRLVLTSGAWTNKVLQSVGLHLPLTVTEEQVTYFATPNLRQFAPDRFPVWIWHGEDCFYGFPVYGEVATKAGQDIGGDVVTVDTRKLAPNPRPLGRLKDFLAERIPGFLGPVLYTKPCLYTLPPDRGFILDRLPELPQISLAIGAGHAFKFATLIGRILSELAAEGTSHYPIEALSLRRPAITDPSYPSSLRLLG